MGYDRLNIAFFCEAGSKRGLGHLIRLYTIYEAFKADTFRTQFFVDSDIDLTNRYTDIIQFTWDKFKLHQKYDAIFIDSYEANLEVYNTIASSCKLAIYLDDYRRLEYPEGLILNFSPDANEVLYKIKDRKHIYLLGLEYVPIRKIFSTDEVEKIEQLFIMLGGTDNKRLTTTISSYLRTLDIQQCVVTNNKDDAKVLEKIDNVNVLFQPDDKSLAYEMKRSSIAISTASMSAYELTFCNTKNIIIATSKNQEIGAISYIRHNLAHKFVSIESKDYLSTLKDAIQTRTIQNKKIDSKGAQRIFNKVMEILT